MNDLISKQDVLKALCCVCKIHDSDPCPVEGVCRFYKALEAVPSAEKTGKWIDRGSLSCRCSECGCKSSKEYTYCPNCGARMVEE